MPDKLNIEEQVKALAQVLAVTVSPVSHPSRIYLEAPDGQELPIWAEDGDLYYWGKHNAYTTWRRALRGLRNMRAKGDAFATLIYAN